MKNLFLILSCALSLLSCNTQNTTLDYNFGFEYNTQNAVLPDGWFAWGNTTPKTESSIFQSGKKSAVIHSDMANRTGGLAYILLNTYEGKEITLEGYIKTENVENAAGLFITLGEQQIFLDSKDIKTETIKGTTDWKKYTVSFPFTKDSGKIMIGGFLKGKGKAWFDNFNLYIDGKNIEELVPSQDQYQSKDEFFVDSQFRIDSLNSKQISNLYQLGKTWGYLKYHSPIIAKGNINWDYELFRFLPNIDSNHFDSLLYSWSRSFGGGIQTEIKKNHYIEFYPDSGNAVFKNEESYPRMKWDDDGMKLLTLFRYWNSINYFFPYKDIIGQDWDLILKHYIPKLLHTHDELSYKLALMELIKEINDSHASSSSFGSTIDEFYGLNTAPVETRFVDNQLVITYVDPKITASGLQVGDIITEVDHKKVSDILNEKAQYEPASNIPALLRNLSYKMTRTNENTIALTIKKSNDAIETVQLETVVYETFMVEKQNPAYKEINDHIGYINTYTIKAAEIPAVMKKFMNKKGIIIDLRCYPKEFTFSALSGYLYPEAIEFAQFSTTSLQHPGLFKISETMQTGEKNRDYFKGKVAILVDENTQSASEFIAMALRKAPRSAVVGSQTAGADGNLSEIKLPGNIQTAISGLGVYYPKGKGTQRTGINIDIQAKPTVQSIRNGEDLQLQKAVEFINQ